MKLQMQLLKLEDLVINPVTNYKSITNFWVEDFEDINNSIENDETSTTFLQLSNENHLALRVVCLFQFVS